MTNRSKTKCEDTLRNFLLFLYDFQDIENDQINYSDTKKLLAWAVYERNRPEKEVCKGLLFYEIYLLLMTGSFKKDYIDHMVNDMAAENMDALFKDLVRIFFKRYGLKKTVSIFYSTNIQCNYSKKYFKSLLQYSAYLSIHFFDKNHIEKKILIPADLKAGFSLRYIALKYNRSKSDIQRISKKNIYDLS